MLTYCTYRGCPWIEEVLGADSATCYCWIAQPLLNATLLTLKHWCTLLSAHTSFQWCLNGVVLFFRKLISGAGSSVDIGASQSRLKSTVRKIVRWPGTQCQIISLKRKPYGTLPRIFLAQLSHSSCSRCFPSQSYGVAHEVSCSWTRNASLRQSLGRSLCRTLRHAICMTMSPLGPLSGTH